MSKKDYVAIAKAIRETLQTATPAEKRGIRRVAHNLCSTFGTDNPRFSSTGFLDAALSDCSPVK